MYQFREATAKDFTGICQLIKSKEELFLIYPSGTFPLTTAQVKKIANLRKALTVIEDKNKIIGFANFYNYEKGKSAFIGNVVIDESYRGKGLGKKLMSKMLEIADKKYKLPEINISVFNTNTPALLLYNNFDFIPYACDIKKDLSGNKIVLLHMKKMIA